jgi:hypothetical protein
VSETPVGEGNGELQERAAAFTALILDLALSEAEATSIQLLAANGFPTDLTRAPTPAEVASRTSFAGIEAEIAAATIALLPLLGQLRETTLALLAAVLRTGTTVAAIVSRLDLLLAGIQLLPGSARALEIAENSLRTLLNGLARRAAGRVLADALVAGLTTRVLQTPYTGPAAQAAESTVAQIVSRLAVDTIADALRAARSVAHARNATASAAGVRGDDFAIAVTDAVRADGITSAQRRVERADARAQRGLQGGVAPVGAGGGDRDAGEPAARPPARTPARQPAQEPARTPARSSQTDEQRIARAAADAAIPSTTTDAAHQAALGANGAGRLHGLSAYEEAVRDGAARGGRLYASELLDRNTCQPCDDVDGTTYPNVTAALADYPLGQYRLCEGGTRCRGTLVLVDASEVAPTLQTPYGR